MLDSLGDTIIIPAFYQTTYLDLMAVAGEPGKGCVMSARSGVVARKPLSATDAPR